MVVFNNLLQFILGGKGNVLCVAVMLLLNKISSLKS